MIMRLMPLAVLLTSILASPIGAQAQDGSDPMALRVEVTISRHRGDTLVSSQPYMLSIVAESQRMHTARLSTAAEVPVPIVFQTPAANAAGDSAPDASRPAGPFNYRSLGIDIECLVQARGEGRHQLTLAISESSVHDPDQPFAQTFRAAGAPVFRSFESDNTLLLHDGQSRRYVAATDPVSGETVQVDVTLTVLD